VYSHARLFATLLLLLLLLCRVLAITRWFKHDRDCLCVNKSVCLGHIWTTLYIHETTHVSAVYSVAAILWLQFMVHVMLQVGSNMTGTNCDLFTHKQSRSYLNYLVFRTLNVSNWSVLSKVYAQWPACFLYYFYCYYLTKFKIGVIKSRSSTEPVRPPHPPPAPQINSFDNVWNVETCVGSPIDHSFCVSWANNPQ
jgi:hypothetical protein